jgi:Fic family protein
MNDFQRVRPRGADAASTAKQPRKTNHSKAPMEGNVHLLLDSNGRQTVSLERRTSGITIENREQRLASEAKQARIAGGVR